MSLKKNVLANLGGSAWSALMGLAFVPFYIKLMGVESYGIVGVFTSLVGMLAVLDLGLSQAMTREMALLSTDKKDVGRMADTARTLEIIYWCIGLCVVAAIVLLSNFIAYRWLKPEQLSRESLLHALWIMALVIGLRWPVAIYNGGLNGLQRQVVVNALLVLFTSLQGAGALAVLWFIEPTIHAFFLWQALIALLQVAALRIALWRSFSAGTRASFRKDVLRDIWRFAAGMSGISFAAVILTQLDKILLSRMLSLSEFGYYVFAATVAGALYRIVGPIFTAYYPRLTELVSIKDRLGLVKTYHQACQLMALAILPATLILVFFAKEILELWTNNPEVVKNCSLLVSLLVIGNALNGFMNIPYALQLAYGWTKLSFYINVVAVIVLAPAIYFATSFWGVAGAAGVWIVLNSGYVVIGIQLMHRRLLPNEKWRWYIDDVAIPLAITVIVVGIGRAIMMKNLGAIEKAIVLLTIFGMATISIMISSKSIRIKFGQNAIN